MRSSSAVRSSDGFVPKRRLSLVVSFDQSDEELVSEFIRGNEQAFVQIFRRYQARIIGYIFKIVRDSGLAEDLSQEVFMRVHDRIRQFDRTKRFSSWLFAIARNFSLNERRTFSKDPLILFQTLEDRKEERQDEFCKPTDFGSDDKTPDKLFEQNRLKGIVDDCIRKLPAVHRDIFILREIQGKSYIEISEITGLNSGTVKSRLARARRSFIDYVLQHKESSDFR